MKKIILLFSIIFISIAVSAQEQSTSRAFYGVDFSNVNVIGAKESPEEFIQAFEQINYMLIAEASRYNIGKYASFDVSGISISYSVSRLKELASENFKDRETEEVDRQGVVMDYADGKPGLVVVCTELNKNTGRGIFEYLFFDADGVFTDCVVSDGKADGSGLNNYWAGALRQSMKRLSALGDILNGEE